ncbi:MAG: oligosaccharide flippase family protein [Lachnospiraceae bacterium]|nr:oligosaccharide flippase family protein [Lachnospiraceae bacterium]
MKKVLQKFHNASPAVKASMALLFSNMILKGLSLISGPIFTRIMTESEYGIVSTFLSWQSILTVIVTLNLSAGVFNNGMLEFKEDRDRFSFSLLVISVILSVIYGIAFLLFKDHFIKITELQEELLIVMFFHFLFVPAYGLWGGRQRYEYKYKALSIITIGIAVLSLIVGITAVLLCPDDKDSIAKVVVTEGVTICVGVVFFIILGVKSKFRININYCKYALKFNLPLIPHYLSMYVLSGSDRIMITKLIDASMTAIYSVAYTVASVINIVWTSLEASLSPWIYEKLEKHEEEEVKKLTNRIVLLFGIMCIVCTLFAPEIIAILAPKSYYKGVYVIPPVAAGVYFTAIYSLYMRIELFYKQTKFAPVATMFAALCNIVLNWIFIPQFGFVAAGYTTMFCYIILAICHYLNLRKKNLSGVFDNTVIFVLSVIVVLLSIIISMLYANTELRYGVILVVLLVCIIKRNVLIENIKKALSKNI